MHETREGSSAFVFDMMEPERPKVDRAVLDFIKANALRPADFTISPDGVCRLNPEMARRIVEAVGRPDFRDGAKYLL
jgi:CRISPR-associated protein Cas1